MAEGTGIALEIATVLSVTGDLPAALASIGESFSALEAKSLSLQSSIGEMATSISGVGESFAVAAREVTPLESAIESVLVTAKEVGSGITEALGGAFIDSEIGITSFKDAFKSIDTVFNTLVASSQRASGEMATQWEQAASRVEASIRTMNSAQTAGVTPPSPAQSIVRSAPAVTAALPYTKDDRSEADYLNRDNDLAYNQMRRDADAENASLDARRRQERTEAEFQNRDFDSQRRQANTNAMEAARQDQLRKESQRKAGIEAGNPMHIDPILDQQDAARRSQENIDARRKERTLEQNPFAKEGDRPSSHIGLLELPTIIAAWLEEKGISSAGKLERQERLAGSVLGLADTEGKVSAPNLAYIDKTVSDLANKLKIELPEAATVVADVAARVKPETQLPPQQMLEFNRQMANIVGTNALLMTDSGGGDITGNINALDTILRTLNVRTPEQATKVSEQLLKQVESNKTPISMIQTELTRGASNATLLGARPEDTVRTMGDLMLTLNQQAAPAFEHLTEAFVTAKDQGDTGTPFKLNLKRYLQGHPNTNPNLIEHLQKQTQERTKGDFLYQHGLVDEHGLPTDLAKNPITHTYDPEQALRSLSAQYQQLNEQQRHDFLLQAEKGIKLQGTRALTGIVDPRFSENLDTAHALQEKQMGTDAHLKLITTDLTGQSKQIVTTLSNALTNAAHKASDVIILGMKGINALLSGFGTEIGQDIASTVLVGTLGVLGYKVGKAGVNSVINLTRAGARKVQGFSGSGTNLPEPATPVEPSMSTPIPPEPVSGSVPPTESVTTPRTSTAIPPKAATSSVPNTQVMPAEPTATPSTSAKSVATGAGGGLLGSIVEGVSGLLLTVAPSVFGVALDKVIPNAKEKPLIENANKSLSLSNLSFQFLAEKLFGSSVFGDDQTTKVGSTEKQAVAAPSVTEAPSLNLQTEKLDAAGTELIKAAHALIDSAIALHGLVSPTKLPSLQDPSTGNNRETGTPLTLNTPRPTSLKGLPQLALNDTGTMSDAPRGFIPPVAPISDNDPTNDFSRFLINKMDPDAPLRKSAEAAKSVQASSTPTASKAAETVTNVDDDFGSNELFGMMPSSQALTKSIPEGVTEALQGLQPTQKPAPATVHGQPIIRPEDPNNWMAYSEASQAMSPQGAANYLSKYGNFSPPHHFAPNQGITRPPMGTTTHFQHVPTRDNFESPFRTNSLPSSSTGSRAPGALPSAQTLDRAKQAMDFFESKGRTPEQAAGIVANLMQESGMRENAVGDHGNALGIAQWHGDRRKKLENAGFKIEGASFIDQLKAVDYELSKGQETTAGEALSKAKTAAEAGSIISKLYERPANREGEATARGKMAELGMLNWQTSPSSIMSKGPDQSKLSDTNSDDFGRYGYLTSQNHQMQEHHHHITSELDGEIVAQNTVKHIVRNSNSANNGVSGFDSAMTPAMPGPVVRMA